MWGNQKDKCKIKRKIYFSESLEFSTLTSEDILKMSETLIYNSRIYDRETHEIIENGPLDIKMVNTKHFYK